MLWCLRMMLLVVPLGMGAALLWVLEEGRGLEFRTDDDLVVVVGREVREVSPMNSSGGVERQIETMMFDRLFRRDDEMVLRGNLVESWAYHQQVVLFFAEIKIAEKAEALVTSMIAAERGKGPSSKFEAVNRNGAALSVTFSAYDEGNVKKVLGALADLMHVPVLKVRLSMKNAVRESWADFKKGSSEKGQIKREWFEGDQAVVFFAAGDVEQFLKELRLYYESNRNLEPNIELIRQQSCLDVVEWVMTLREGVTWHDGRPMTSRDVLFSYEEMMRPVAASPLRSDFSYVASVRVLDEHRILVECREFYAPIAESWERLPILPSHLLAGKKEGDWEEFYQRPVGTGPYSFEGRLDTGELVLKRNVGHFRGSPQQERVKFQFMRNHNDRLRAVRTASVDILWPSEMELFQAEGDARVQVLDDSYRQQTLVAWNLRKAKFEKKEVRQALAHFVDVSALIDEVEGKGIRLCRGIFHPGSWFCKTPMELPNFDPEKGRTLLEEAGWRFDEGGWKNPEGQALAFKLLLDRDSAGHMKLASVLAERWREQGIDVELFPMVWSDLVTGHLNVRDFDAALVSWELGYGRDQYQVWHSSQSEPSRGNFFGLNSGPVDRNLESLRNETEPEEIRSLAENLQDSIQRLQPCLYLYESADSIVLRKGGVRLARPKGEGVWTNESPRSSPSGLQNEWTWWSRAQKSGVRGKASENREQ